MWGGRVIGSLAARALIAWLISLVALQYDESTNYDYRFQVRPSQPLKAPIALVLVNEQEWYRWVEPSINMIRPLKEIGPLTDSYFWNEELWTTLIRRLLEVEVKAIGVTFFFGENIPRPRRLSSMVVFENPRVYWSARLDAEGRTRLPRFAPRIYSPNAGLVDLTEDLDGVLRRVIPTPSTATSLPLSLAREIGDVVRPNHVVETINYLGPPDVFPTFTFAEILTNSVQRAKLRGHVVLVGARQSAGQELQTPLGPMPKAAVIGNILHNLAFDEWVKKAPTWFYAIYLLVLCFLFALISIVFPPLLTLTIFFVVWGFIAAASTWMFDVVHFWLPIASPIIMGTLILALFVTWQLTEKDRLNWLLEQESSNLRELEIMKNNFVSLFSHDLKTPLAKISATLDKLKFSALESEISEELGSLRKASYELHRYIQSILQVIRVEAVDFKLHKQPVDINDIVLRLVDELKPLAQEKNSMILQDLEPLFSVEVDPVLIKEVLQNLIENAIKYTPNGSIVKVITREHENMVDVTVIDNGPGIGQSDLERVWEKFYRGSQSELHTRGSGLGLYFVKYFVELHGGRVFVSSEINQGTKIGFTLPL